LSKIGYHNSKKAIKIRGGKKKGKSYRGEGEKLGGYGRKGKGSTGKTRIRQKT